MGHGRVVDHMFLDGLEDAYDKGRLMGTFAEDCAREYQFTREAQDEFALRSLSRAHAGDARRRLSPGRSRRSRSRPARATTMIAKDEQPAKARPTRSRR